MATLKRHGIDVQELREDIELDVELYRVDEVGKPASSGWDRQDVVELRVSSRQETKRVPAGTLMVKTAQPLGNLGGLLARAPLRRWPGSLEILRGSVKAGGDFPVLRLRDPCRSPRRSRSRWPRTQARPAYHIRHGGRAARRRDALGSPVSVTWLDGEYWLQIREGKLHKVQATTGRSSRSSIPKP